MLDPEFFPTPSRVISQMLAKVNSDARYFLEPSAGKGDIAKAIIERSRFGSHSDAKVDCIESSPELASILSANGFPVVGYDWLDYAGVCYYDAIVMNPPFSNGDDHILKAWDFLYDGEIVCLLNEETIKNTYTEARKRLASLIEQHGSVEWLGDCFSRQAERRSDVNVALVYLKKSSGDDTMDMWARDSEEKEHSTDGLDYDQNMIAIRDDLGNMQHYYDAANEHMLKALHHIRKATCYMDANKIHVGTDYEHVLSLAFRNSNSARAEFGKKHRRDAWMHVFDRMEFRKWLDKKQTDEFVRSIERDGNIPFTKENIKGTLQNVWSQRTKLFEQSVVNVFDELTRYFNGNSNHTEGWKTNDSYKVNEKLVFPWGCTYDAKFMHCFDISWGHSPIDIYNDLDRVLCVLDGSKFEECLTIERALRDKFRSREDLSAPNNKCESTHFEIKFWKKGTVHLVFKDRELWKKFNVTASRSKKWIGQNTKDAA